MGNPIPCQICGETHTEWPDDDLHNYDARIPDQVKLAWKSDGGSSAVAGGYEEQDSRSGGYSSK